MNQVNMDKARAVKRPVHAAWRFHLMLLCSQKKKKVSRRELYLNPQVNILLCRRIIMSPVLFYFFTHNRLLWTLIEVPARVKELVNRKKTQFKSPFSSSDNAVARPLPDNKLLASGDREELKHPRWHAVNPFLVGSCATRAANDNDGNQNIGTNAVNGDDGSNEHAT